MRQACVAVDPASNRYPQVELGAPAAGVKAMRIDSMNQVLELPEGYSALLESLKAEVRSTQRRAHLAVNTEMLRLYWRIGRAILDRQESEGWGARVIDRLAADLRAAFPDMRGFSRSNLHYMRRFASAWVSPEVVPQPVGQLPWGHVRLLLDKVPDPVVRDWYASQTAVNGWTRNVLLNAINSRTHDRVAAAPSNFQVTLDPAEATRTQLLIKDPYVFDFLALTGAVAERDLEAALIDNLQRTLLELGTGFAFVGRQVHFDVDGDDFYLDLLLFHTTGLRYFAIELKIGRFAPEHLGQLNFYVRLVDDRLRSPDHASTVGLLLCAERNRTVVRYALAGATGPMAVSTYTYDVPGDGDPDGTPTGAQVASALKAALARGWVDSAT